MNYFENRELRNYVVVNLLMALFYAWFYDFIFSNYIAVLFDTIYIPMDRQQILMYFGISVFPIVFYRGLRNIASIFSLFVYIFAYVPFMETLSVCGYGPEYNDYRIVFFVSMCLFFLTDSWEFATKSFRKTPRISYETFEKLSFSILFFVVFLNISNLHFTNFLENRDDMYDLREDLAVIGGAPVAYLLYWLKNVLLPILYVSSLQKRKVWKILVSFVGCMLMYSIDQQKITFLSPCIISILYFVYKLNEQILRNCYHVFIMMAMIIFPFLCFFYQKTSDAIYEIAAILIMRTQCIEGLELNTYLDFFGHDGTHPYTYYSHIGIVNLFTDAYPYDTALGKVVTYHGANANGMFWLMDGIAAYGLYGCIFIGLLFIFMKSFFNGIKYKCDVLLFSIISIFSMSMTMNVSLFTSLFSCGWLLFYVLFVFVDFKHLRNRGDNVI